MLESAAVIRKNTLLGGRKDYWLMDAMKFFMAILVVSIHRSPFSGESTAQFFTINILARTAVPFFFASSGFLFREKLDRSENQRKVFLSYIKRLTILYLIWSAIYFPLTFYKKVILANQKIPTFVVSFIKNFFVGEGSYCQLWYLPSLIVSVTFVYLLSRRLSAGKIFFITVLVYIAGLLCTNYSFLFGGCGVSAVAVSFSENYKILSDTLTGGLVFTATGLLVSEKKEHLRKSILIPAAVISFALMTAEAFLVSAYSFHYIYAYILFLVPVTFFLTAIAVTFSLRERKLYLFMRKSNVLIYFVHLISFQRIVRIICSALGVGALGNNNVIYFLAVVAYSLVFSAVVIALEKKKPFRFLKYLH